MTPEDIFRRLTLKDDPDAADIYRRLIQRGGGDGRATSAEVANASAPAEQQADMFDALLRAANMDLGEPDGPAWCFYLSRERCRAVHHQIMHITDASARWQEILVRMTPAGAVPVRVCLNHKGPSCDYPRPHLMLPPPIVIKLQPARTRESRGPQRRRPTLASAPRR